MKLGKLIGEVLSKYTKDIVIILEDGEEVYYDYLSEMEVPLELREMYVREMYGLDIGMVIEVEEDRND